MGTLEFEFHTFSLVARCERTGMYGVATATHAIAVGSRCSHARAGIGAVATQAVTDPRVGPLALDMLEMGYSADAALAGVVAVVPKAAYRQIGVVDRDGSSAAYTGESNQSWAGHITEKDFVSMGNNLIGPATIEAMAEVFRRSAGMELEERLLRAIEAGRDAGGQNGGQRSASLIVYDREVYPWVDLRVDAHDEPIAELRRVFEVYKPMREFFSKRALIPEFPAPPDA